MARELPVHFILDLDDDDCPDSCLHLAAFLGNIQSLREILQDPLKKDLIRARIRPFLSTPLRLAATGGHVECIEELLENGAEVDEEDIKAQTPLFVALVNQHWSAARTLLEHGANPNGSLRNLCSPLSILCQRGLEQGIQLLCEYGVDTEDITRIMSGMPGLPLTTCATYHHLRSFVILLLNGAAPDLKTYRNLDLRDFVNSQCSVPHTVIKYKCPVEFLYLYREFGGNMKLRDAKGLTASEICDNAPALEYLRKVQDTPLSLLSQSRLAIRRSLNNKLHEIQNLDIGENLLDILLFKCFSPSDFDLDKTNEVEMYNNLLNVCRTVQIHEKTPKGRFWRRKLDADVFQFARDLEADSLEENNNQETVFGLPPPIGGGPLPPPVGGGPPPPPPPPVPPKPKLFRYPGAEGMKKKHFSGY
ncbi:ankyrin repeat and SOCS box protein 1 isoform X1 [Eurytemora carolleeae]|uniref:ankyrin repeat and SOCS box protein 1 isoform X1 n=1 Tax=Eurytemora carolleeae TaxID=1294199 RepID=UPI000C76FE3D|nr:ankyrin repeat and SOCS box protein 1 isoform X1 [Eurytemora carolleeae]|eukprot:XP_023341380.1 ankyrin repeat and SOCS box protein 1-like isoform X1 [Eurytemora affinis]